MMRKFYIILIILILTVCNLTSAEERNTTFIYPPWKHTWGIVRATPFKLRLFAGDKTHFNNPQGIACVRLEAWEDTTKTGDDDEITVYGVNSGDNCIIYNSSMFSLGIYGLDPDHEKFDKPWGIAADAKGNVYVVDRGNSRVVRLFNPGKHLRYVSTIGAPGNEAGYFIDPRGVALDPSGNIYVTDAALDRITVFNDSGEVKAVWEGFTEPDGIAVVGENEEWTYHPNQHFAVVIDSVSQVKKVTLDGVIVTSTKADDWGIANADFAYVTLDYHNQVLITDRNNGCIHKLDSDLNYITTFGESGSSDYQFDEPRGIGVYRRFGQIIVAERQGAQYLWVAVNVENMRANVKVDSIWKDLSVDFFLTEPSLCKLDVLDKYGRFVARITKNRRFHSGNNHLEWGLRVPRSLPKDQSAALPPEYKPGQMLPTGEYKLRAEIRATYSSREHFFREVETNFILK